MAKLPRCKHSVPSCSRSSLLCFEATSCKHRIEFLETASFFVRSLLLPKFPHRHFLKCQHLQKSQCQRSFAITSRPTSVEKSTYRCCSFSAHVLPAWPNEVRKKQGREHVVSRICAIPIIGRLTDREMNSTGTKDSIQGIEAWPALLTCSVISKHSRTSPQQVSAEIQACIRSKAC